MSSPFPGMDPYLEDPIEWPDLHVRLMVAMSRQLTAQAAPHFYVRVKQRASIIGQDDVERRGSIPDAYRAQFATQSNALPTFVTMLEEPELREHYIEIYDARNREVVATIELLSPVNKISGGKRAAFLAKRRAVMASPAHWLEIDLLRAGERPPEVAGKSDYYALLKRGGHIRPFEVWYANLRDPLPVIAVPLRAPYADVPLDLQAAFASAYAEARYNDQMSYTGVPPQPPLVPADAAWAAARIDAWRKSSASSQQI
ncbi:MAG TPA: DUF4058 family protein [Roseiflexaceae bacterium]|nr:DUF4058 family protein [Roseiflexaceae bacterium]HMP43387.1 DUF4058 family protein [Roseiflexaceae bacterium]